MNPRKIAPPQAHSAKRTLERQPIAPRLHMTGVAQPKAVTASHAKKLPVAPPAYRPQPVPKVLQRKTANGQQRTGEASLRPAPTLIHRTEPKNVAQPKMAVTAGAPKPLKSPPQVYRPQPTPRVLQTKTAGQKPPQATGQTPLRPAALPGHRAELRKTVQPKMASSALPKGMAAYRPHPSPQGRMAGGTIQRMLSTLTSIAEEMNESRTGKKESRNTQAVVLTEDGKTLALTQRESTAFDEAIETAEVSYGVTIDERVIADQKDDEGIHAEMLAVSWWLQGNIKKPKKIGVSQGICARCQAVLDALGITGAPAGGHYTKNWVHPYRHAGMTPPKGALSKLPQKVTRGKEYSW